MYLYLDSIEQTEKVAKAVLYYAKIYLKNTLEEGSEMAWPAYVAKWYKLKKLLTGLQNSKLKIYSFYSLKFHFYPI